MSFTENRVLVAISGGVDSSATALILREQGYTVSGAVLDLSDAHTESVIAAKKVCDNLGIPLSVLHMHDEFNETVIKPFCRTYCCGRTPNPCVFCNPILKFRAISDFANSLGIHFIASGHYARVVEENGVYLLKKSVSTARDQSYMLYRLPQTILSRLIMPLGSMEKSEVRKLARDNSVPSSEAPDSQEICFIPDNDYPAFIERMGFHGKQGRFISPEGTPLCDHKGVHNYTVGQRRGLGVALGRPVFVKSIEDNGDIILGYSGEEFATSLVATDAVISPKYSHSETISCSAKIRSAAKESECLCRFTDSGFELIFDSPVRAPAPGQSAVLYDGDTVIGGGVIDVCRA